MPDICSKTGQWARASSSKSYQPISKKWLPLNRESKIGPLKIFRFRAIRALEMPFLILQSHWISESVDFGEASECKQTDWMHHLVNTLKWSKMYWNGRKLITHTYYKHVWPLGSTYNVQINAYEHIWTYTNMYVLHELGGLNPWAAGF